MTQDELAKELNVTRQALSISFGYRYGRWYHHNHDYEFGGNREI